MLYAPSQLYQKVNQWLRVTVVIMRSDTIVNGSKEDELSDTVLAQGTVQFRSNSGGAFKGFKKRTFAVTTSYITYEKPNDPSTRLILPMKK